MLVGVSIVGAVASDASGTTLLAGADDAPEVVDGMRGESIPHGVTAP